MDLDAARRLLMGAEYDTREDVPVAVLVERFRDLAPITGVVHAFAGLFALPDSARLLDLGCGAGTFALAASRANPGIDAVGLDLSAGAIAAARRAAAALGLPRARFEVADFEHDPLPSADAVLLAYSLSLAADPGRALANAARSLRPSGRLVVFDAAWAGNALPLPRLDALAEEAGLEASERADVTTEVRKLAACGAWPWSNAPSPEARFVVSAYRKRDR